MAGKENREIKNSVFVDLFYEDESAEANEIALFNAIHDKPLPEGTKIRRFRVDNTIYMNFQNDISFDAGGKVIVFGEHQSTAVSYTHLTLPKAIKYSTRRTPENKKQNRH